MLEMCLAPQEGLEMCLGPTLFSGSDLCYFSHVNALSWFLLTVGSSMSRGMLWVSDQRIII